MRLSVLTPLILLAARCLAQSPLAALPTCALNCVEEYVNSTGCAATDLACLCANEVFLSETKSCARANCTVKEGLTALNVTATACHAPVRDSSTTMKVLGPTFATVATIFVLIRLAVRWDTLGWDDAAIVLALATGATVAGLNYTIAMYGLGKDVWTVPFDDISNVLYYFYISEPFYVVSTIFTKIALCLFLLRIFTDRNFRIVVWVVIALCVGTDVAFVFSLIFQCTPIPFAWLGWTGEMKGSCLRRNDGTWANAAVNIILDIIILALPLDQLRRMHSTYSRRKKFQIMIMFSVGGFVTIVSILRLKSIIGFMNSVNYTYDNLGTAVWSNVEIFTGIICACLPAARVFFGRTLPNWVGVTTNGSAHGAAAYADPRNPPEERQRVSWNAITSMGSNTRHSRRDSRDFMRLEDVGQDQTSISALKA